MFFAPASANQNVLFHMVSAFPILELFYFQTGDLSIMKGILSLILQLLGLFLVVAFVFSLINYTFGWHLGMKGQEVPSDPGAAFMFLGIGLVSAGAGFLLDRSKPIKQAG